VEQGVYLIDLVAQQTVNRLAVLMRSKWIWWKSRRRLTLSV